MVVFCVELFSVFVDGYSITGVHAYACSMLSTVRPVIRTNSEASETWSYFLVLRSILPFQSGFLPHRLLTFDGILI